jgi:DNA-binding transcriptional ArsR family regulator
VLRAAEGRFGIHHPVGRTQIGNEGAPLGVVLGPGTVAKPAAFAGAVQGYRFCDGDDRGVGDFEVGRPVSGGRFRIRPLTPILYFYKYRIMELPTAVQRLAALAQETRLAIFRLLVQTGPEGLCVGDIGSTLKLTPATLSFHLKELTHAGLLKSRQQGRFIYYAPDFKAMNALVDYLTENCCGGASCEASCAPAKPSPEKRR